MGKGLITVRDGTQIFYCDVGSGPAVVMVPAWSMTADAFFHQSNYLSSQYRAIALDPRGQGRSSTTMEGNDYVTHAHDLYDVTQHLGLSCFALVGWSNGALAAAHYMRIYGTREVRAFVNIDMPAMAIPKSPGDWAEVPGFEAFHGLLVPLATDPAAFRSAMVSFFVQRELSDAERQWLLEQMRSQAPFVGRLLMSDILFYDFADLLKRVTATVPTLLAVRKEWAATAEAWASQACPMAEFAAFHGGHMFFWEDPDPFNVTIGRFLENAPPRSSCEVSASCRVFRSEQHGESRTP